MTEFLFLHFKFALYYVIIIYYEYRIIGGIMNINVNDILIMKKQHPCGCKRFTVLRIGMDFKIRCENCGRDIMAPRVKIEKNIKKVESGEKDDK